MKKILLILTLVLSTVFTFSQSARYYQIKNTLIQEGWSIADEKYGNCVQGDYVYYFRTFYSNQVYKVVAMSDDSDVSDVDIWIYYPDGDVFKKDADSSSLAVVDFKLNYQWQFKVLAQNYRSRTPSYASTMRLIVAYK